MRSDPNTVRWLQLHCRSRQIASVLLPLARVRVYAEVSVDHSIEPYYNGVRRRFIVRPSASATLL